MRFRLLSPRRVRIWEPDPEKPVTELNRTAANLQHAGWTPYDGPAQTDKRGWVIGGTDPELVPLSARVTYPAIVGKG